MLMKKKIPQIPDIISKPHNPYTKRVFSMHVTWSSESSCDKQKKRADRKVL